MYINLSGLNILITGASKGIGKALATKLAEAGATIAIHYNKGIREAENLSHILGNDSRIFHGDLSNPDDAFKLFDRVVLEMGNVDILINNAGVAMPAALEEDDDEWLAKWNQTLQVNLTSSAILCKCAVQHFLEKRIAGRIINISSKTAFKGEKFDYLAYAASKAGMVALTKSIANDYGKSGIRSFVIAPGLVRTDMAKDFVSRYGEEQAKGDISLERMTEPKDLAPLVTFIASGMADHATGSTFDVNGGSYMH